MTWSVWDIVVVSLAVLQVAVLAGIAMTILRIKNGPVDRLIGKGKIVADHGKALAQTGKSVFEANREHALILAARASGLVNNVRGATGFKILANEAITYAKFVGAIATIRKVRSGFAMAADLRRGGVKGLVARALPKKTTAPVRRSFADRMGLLPPIAGRLAPVIRIARTAFGVHRQLKNRGLY